MACKLYCLCFSLLSNKKRNSRKLFEDRERRDWFPGPFLDETFEAFEALEAEEAFEGFEGENEGFEAAFEAFESPLEAFDFEKENEGGFEGFEGEEGFEAFETEAEGASFDPLKASKASKPPFFAS